MNPLVRVAAPVAFVLAGAFLPWATIHGTARPLPDRLTGDPLGMEMTVTAWNGHVRYGDFTIPNIFPVVTAIGAAIACWLNTSGNRPAAQVAAIGLALCGLVHMLCFLTILARMQSGTVGPGALVTAGGMGILLLVLLFQRSPEGDTTSH